MTTPTAVTASEGVGRQNSWAEFWLTSFWASVQVRTLTHIACIAE